MTDTFNRVQIMNKIKKTLTITLIIFSFVFIWESQSEASSFVRRRPKERTDDSVYGRNWDRMDRHMDEMIDGPSERSQAERNNNQTRFTRRPQQENRQNQGNSNRNQNRSR